MSEDQNIKIQRDKFLAFSFASADLFLEIGKDGQVIFSTGALKALLGIEESRIKGLNWLEIFDSKDRPVVKMLKYGASPGKRAGPIVVKLDNALVKNKNVILSGIKMPGSESFYLSIAVSGPLISRMADDMKASLNEGLLSREAFTEAAQENIIGAKLTHQDLDLTLLEIDTSDENIEKIGPDKWNAVVTSIGHLLKTKSVDGRSAGEISKGKYSVLHDKSISTDSLKEQVALLADENDIADLDLNVTSKTVSSDLSELSERDASRALVYTINEFERKGTDITIDRLNNGFEAYLAANAEKVKDFHSFIERQSFGFVYQPIVDLGNLELVHYEILSRFDEGDTLEWVMFGEDMGLAPEFDMAVCERAIHYLTFKAGGTRTKYSINISGQSIEDPNFFTKLTKMLDSYDGLSDRLIFEITESAQIQNLSRVSQFVRDLQDQKYEVALDDFGAGSASFQYIQNLNVDYVKIDGRYTRRILNSQRDVAMIKNLTQMCKDLGIKVVAEYVEDSEQIEILRNLGVMYGQGYYFGKPESAPHYTKPKS